MKQVFGYSDEITECGCCGKTNLKGTYSLSIDNGPVVHFGSSCVKKNFGISITSLNNAATRANQTGKAQVFVKL